MRRYIERRDANEPAIVAAAESLGAAFWRAPPLDGWLHCTRLGGWQGPVEIKLPHRAGRSDEYTAAQRRFMRWCEERRAPWYTLRTVEDVMALLGAHR